MRIVHVIGNLLLQLALALLGIDRLSGALYNIGRSVILRSMSSRPEGVERNLSTLQFLRDHGKTETHTGKACVLREGTKLDCAGSRALTLVDAVRDIRLGDICLVGGIIDDDSAHPVRIVHPFLQLCLCDRGAGRVIREAQIDQIGRLLRQLRREAVFRRTRHIDDLAPGLLHLVIGSGSARHDVGIHIHGIDRVADSNFIVKAEYLLNIAGIAFCAVGDKNLIRGNIAAARLVIILRNGISKELITEIRRIAVEGLGMSHLVHRLVQRLNDRRGKRLCDVSDSETYDLLVRMCRAVGADLFANRREKIASRQFQIIFIYSKHSFPLFCAHSLRIESLCQVRADTNLVIEKFYFSISISPSNTVVAGPVI